MSNLPALPRVLKKREADFGLLFRAWIMEHPFASDASFELKDSRGSDSLAFSEVADLQINYGQRIKSDKGTLIRVQGINGEPDYIYLRKAPAFIVIKYPRLFVLIDVDVFVKESKRSLRRSLTSVRAIEISTDYVDF